MNKYTYSFFLIFLSHFIFSQSFHDTQGKLDISNTGQAVYTIPIALPPSLQNFGPTINLTYVSGQFGGIVGQGWNLSTISMISRISTNITLDGVIDGVDFDDNDKLALDGQRLILKTGIYWENGSTYETEIQSNNKIELKLNGNNIYFIVTNTDGSRTWYGNYDGTIINDINTYNIARHEDKNGNYIIFNYFKPFNKGLCLKEIKFSANVNDQASPLNSILFNYKLAKRSEFSYLNNEKIWKEALLSDIEVKTNNQLFRKYIVTHEEDITNGYEKVSKIQEFNSLLEPANPILFEYKDTPSNSNSSEEVKSYDGFLTPSSGMVSGDFDGDGYVDFMNEGKIYTKLFQNSGGTINGVPINGYSFNPITTLSTDNKLNQFQSYLDINYLNLFNLTLTAKHLDTNTNTIVSDYSKTIDFPNHAFCNSNCANNPCTNLYEPRTQSLKTFEGDFNGDGVSELLILAYPEQKTKQSISITTGKPDPSDSCTTTITIGDYPNYSRILDLNPNSSTVLGTKGYVNISYALPIHKKNKTIVMDFNGDGKADILSINEDKTYYIIGFKQLNASPWIEVEILGSGTLPDYEKTKVILFGDFNGDGKTDLIIPVARLSSDWVIYYANPKAIGNNDFFEKETHTIFEYNPDTGTPGTPDAQYTTQQHFKNYYVLDINKDGKSDLVVFWVAYSKKEWWQYHNFDTKWQIKAFENNIGRTNISGSKFPLIYESTDEHNSSSPNIPIPLVSTFKVNGANKDFVVLRDSDATATHINFPKNIQEDLLLSKINSSNNVVQDIIEYKKLEPIYNVNNDLGSLSDFYSSTNSVTYPFVEIKKIPTSNVVYKLTNTTDGVVKKQLYKYHGFVVNLHGLGFIGFNKTARSCWFQNDSAEKIWSVSEIYPELRGANKRSYSQLVTSENNFSFTDDYTPENVISLSINEFNTISLTSPYTVLLNKQTSIDFLTNIKNELKYDYSTDGFYIPNTITSKNYLGADLQSTVTTITTFENNVSGSDNNYYIGRPTVLEKTISAYNDTFKTTEKYFYEQNKLKRVEKKGNSLEEKYLIEEYDYTPVGNVWKITQRATSGIIPPLAPRSTEQTFDPTGRFVISSKDVEGLVTTKTFDPIYGQLLTQTNPYGLTTTNEYDSWGKLKKITDYLDNNTTFTYTKENNLFKTLVAGQDGSSSYKLTDVLGRTVRTAVKNIDNNWSYQAYEYDYLGRKIKESDPSAGYLNYYWNTFNYDVYNRLILINYTSGLNVNMTHNGVTTTSTDGTKTTSSTKNANGDVVQATDLGGTIYYTYFANSNLKTSNFENTILTMNYDSFGRKTYLNDPSAGTYTYTYNFYGELIQETTPKGITDYNYDDFGKITNKHIVGTTANEATDILTVYSYDSNTKLLNSETITNSYDGNSSYTYEYDQYKRLEKTVEYQPLAHYQKSYQFDSFGRVAKEFLHAVEISTGKSSSKMIKNNFKNGALWQKIDDSNNKILWSTNTVNARGQLTGGTFGNDLIQTNFYSDTGLPTTFNTFKVVPTARNSSNKTNPNNPNPNDPIEIDPNDPPATENIINMNYNFNQERGLLMNRSTNLFNNYSESFQYDNLERLIEWGSTSEIIYNLQFTGTTSGFTSLLGATVASTVGKLRITTTQANGGAQKLLLSNTPLGTKISISATVNKQNTNKINVVIVEKNPVSNAIVETVLGEANEGLFTADYTINTYKDVYVKFVKSPLSSDVGLSTTFAVDDFILTKFNRQYQQYDNKGRISQSGIGNYAYNINGKAYQNSSVTLSPAGKEYYTQYDRQEITYNAFKSPVAIYEKNYDRINFSYNARQGRSIIFYGGLDADKWQRTYRKQYSSDGTFEIKHNTQTGTVEFLTYIGGDGYSAPVVLKSDGINQEYLYLHRDYLGSIIAISNQEGNLIEKRHFDAWGNAIKIQDALNNNLTKLSVLDRGYTGHEHLQSVGIIHMNGRLYDPMVHRFLQPDNFIQDPHNTQNYNRYGYVLNNPLKYSDPSGEEFLSMVAIGVGVGIAAYILNAIAVEAPITFQGILQTSMMSVFSTTLTFGIGNATESISNFFLKAGVQAVAHGTIQGGLSEFNGDKFINGFASGSLSSLASSAFSGGTNTKIDDDGKSITTTVWRGAGKFARSGVGLVTFGTVSGGLGAKLTGGNFWAGAATGLTVSAFNHLAHKIEEANKRKLWFRDIKKIYDAYNGPNTVNPDQLYESIGGPLWEQYENIMTNNNPADDDYWINTCATRLSKALNDAGFTIPSNVDGAWEGANNKFYIVSAQKLFNYLSKNYNLAGVYPKGTTFMNGITAHSKYGEGIQHIDLFYNGNTKNANHYDWAKHWIFYH